MILIQDHYCLWVNIECGNKSAESMLRNGPLQSFYFWDGMRQKFGHSDLYLSSLIGFSRQLQLFIDNPLNNRCTSRNCKYKIWSWDNFASKKYILFYVFTSNVLCTLNHFSRAHHMPSFTLPSQLKSIIIMFIHIFNTYVIRY